MTNIKILQSTKAKARIEMHQSLPVIVQITLTHSQSTPSSDEDQQYIGQNLVNHDPTVTQLRDKRSTQLSLHNHNHNEQHL